jgi:hypothetical protein
MEQVLLQVLLRRLPIEHHRGVVVGVLKREERGGERNERLGSR